VPGYVSAATIDEDPPLLEIISWSARGVLRGHVESKVKSNP
jgi:hypothetical protein